MHKPIKMPNKTDHSSTIRSLVDDAEKFLQRVNPYEEYPSSDVVRVYWEHKKWMEKVRSTLVSHRIDHYLPTDFYISERLELPQRDGLSISRTVMFLYSSPEGKEYLAKQKQFRQELHGAIKLQINTLENVLKALEDKTKQISIYLDEKKWIIWREPRNKYEHGSTKAPKRLKLILFLSEVVGFAKTKTILARIKYNNVSDLSHEKAKINSLLKKKLGLHEDLIVAERLQGYGINPSYRIIRQ